MLRSSDFPIAVVTGAAKGIGAAVARSLVTSGHRVVGLDRQAAYDVPLTNFALTRTVDVTDIDQVATAADEVEQSLGPVEVLVNAAGVLLPGGTTNTPIDNWRAMLEVNLLGVVRTAECFVPAMSERRHGAVVTIASNAALVPRKGMAAYCTSKAAVTAYMKCLGLELAGSGVRCNVVAPGSTDTAMLRQTWTGGASLETTLGGSLEDYRLGIPLGRVADPEDVAAAVSFLASAAARHLTMHTLTVDGGATLGA